MERELHSVMEICVMDIEILENYRICERFSCVKIFFLSGLGLHINGTGLSE